MPTKRNSGLRSAEEEKIALHEREVSDCARHIKRIESQLAVGYHLMTWSEVEAVHAEAKLYAERSRAARRAIVTIKRGLDKKG